MTAQQLFLWTPLTASLRRQALAGDQQWSSHTARTALHEHAAVQPATVASLPADINSMDTTLSGETIVYTVSPQYATGQLSLASLWGR